MNFIYFYSLCTCFILQTSGVLPPKKHVYFQIDEFIKELMTSEKFDELANVIADKAAQKIRHMENVSPGDINPDILRHRGANKKNDTKSEEKLNNHHNKKTDARSNEKPSYDRKDNKEIDTRSNEKASYDRKDNKEIDTRSNEKASYDRKDNKEIDTRSNEKQSYDRKENKKIDTRSNEKQSYDRKDNKETDTRYHEKIHFDRKKNKEHPRFTEKSDYDREKKNEKDSRSNEKINQDREKESHTENNEKYRKPIKFGNIDTQAFLKNQLTSKELELNYKHLKGELEKHRFDVKGNKPKALSYVRDKNENNRAVDKHEEESEKNEHSRVENNDSLQQKREDSNERKTSDGSSNEHAEHEQAIFNNNDNVKNDGTNSNNTPNYSDSENEERKKSNFKYTTQSSNEKPVPRIDVQTTNDTEEILNYFEDANSKMVDNLDNASREFAERPSSSKEIVVVKLNRAHSDEHTPEIVESKRKSGIRIENGKRYVLDASSEYAEYHDNVAKNHQKYINTYK